MRDAARIGSTFQAWDPRGLALYFALAFGFSVILWAPVLAGKGLSRVYFSVGTFGPTLAALTTHRVSVGSWRAVRLWTDLPHVLLGIVCGGSPVLVAALTAAFFMTKSGFDRWQWPALLQIITLYGPNLLGGPLGEEPGWRGYALPRLQHCFNPVTASLVLGFGWASWHLPLILAHVYNVTWWQFFAVTMAASIFLTFGFNKSGGSTVCAVLIHGVYNVGTPIILNDLITKATVRSNPIQHNIFWMSYVGVAALLCFLTKGHLGFRPRQSGA